MKQLLNAEGVQVGIASGFVETALGWVGDGMVYPTSVVGEGCTVANYTPPPVIEQVTVPREITMRQARLVLLGAGVLASVENAIAALPEPLKSAAKIEWEYSATVQRKNGFVEQLAPIIGLSQKQIDDLFIAGSKL